MSDLLRISLHWGGGRCWGDLSREPPHQAAWWTLPTALILGTLTWEWHPPRSSWEPWHGQCTTHVVNVEQPFSAITPADTRPLTNTYMSFEVFTEDSFLSVVARPPLSWGVVVHFRSSGLDVWENWERTKTQFCIPLHSSCLPLESSQRRQRHPIATPLKDTKGRNPTTEQFFCIFCVDFECQSEKGGDPASGPPPSLPAGEGLMDGDMYGWKHSQI